MSKSEGQYNFVQVHVSAHSICLQCIASCLSFYLHMYICTLSEPQVAQFTLHTQHRTQHRSHQQYLWFNIKEREANFSVKLYCIHLTSCYAQQFQTYVVEEHGLNPSEYPPHSVPAWVYDQHRKSKELTFLDFRNAISPHLGHLIVLAFLLLGL